MYKSGSRPAITPPPAAKGGLHAALRLPQITNSKTSDWQGHFKNLKLMSTGTEFVVKQSDTMSKIFDFESLDRSVRFQSLQLVHRWIQNKFWDWCRNLMAQIQSILSIG